MGPIHDLLAYDAWATSRIFEACVPLSQQELSAPQAAMYGPLLDTLRHMIDVEDGYLALIAASDWRERPREDLDELQARSRRLADAYQALAAGLDAHSLARQFKIPWFDRETTVERGLLQVVVHSTEHRADVAAALTRLGRTPPGLDFILWAIPMDPA